MLKPRSLRVRLGFWYFCALLLVAVILAAASGWAMTVSLNHALDQGLRYRLIGVHRFIDENGQGGLETLRARLGALDILGDLYQVFGPRGELMAQSEGLARHHVSTQPPPDPGAGILFRTGGPHSFPVRLATQRIYVQGQPLLIEVADPERKFQSVVNEFYSVLYIALPIVLALAALGGYWLSGRALAPVDGIIDEAQAINPNNLAARLSVPPSGDELQRLSETLNRMLDRVEQSVLQVRRFTADASHELRAPMALIYTAAQLALRRERSPEELKESLETVLREAKRCKELINEMLWLARADTGGSRPQLVASDLTQLVGAVARETRLLAANKGLELSISLPDHPVMASVEEASFRRMLLILLDNAISYTSLGGIAVQLGEDTGGLAIAVTDTGSGIPAEQLPFIFDRFWRADKVRSRDAGGTGLGLAIAREIAQNHGAELSVESCPGKGSTFTVRIPGPRLERSGISAARDAILSSDPPVTD